MKIRKLIIVSRSYTTALTEPIIIDYILFSNIVFDFVSYLLINEYKQIICTLNIFAI